MIKLTTRENSIIFAVRVQPRASRSEILGELDGALKIRLAAPPVDGEANEELIRYLAKFFGVPRRQVCILSGQTSKNKVIRIDSMTVDEGEQVLHAALGS